jgi:hypothetical protein
MRQKGEPLKKLMACLLAVALSCSCALPAYAKKAPKIKLGPEARSAQKRSKARQKELKHLAKAQNKDRKYLKAAR